MHCNNPELYPGATGQHAGQPRNGLLNGNRWIDSTGTPLPVVAPAAGECLSWLSSADSAEIDAAVVAARAALEGDWGLVTATERDRLMRKFASLEVSNTKTVVSCYL